MMKRVWSVVLVLALMLGALPQVGAAQRDVTDVLNTTMAQLAATVTEPVFGSIAGEWAVFGLARGNYYGKDSDYFADYYERIVEYVNTTAATIDKQGALDKNKSTDNSRLIVALSAIGKDATSVGNWDLVEAYSANGMNWIRKQGLNGTIWTLIALDSKRYPTSDPTLRQQCVDAILSAQHNDGGWSLVTAKAQPSNVDITCMALTALYPYRDQPAVSTACETAIAWLSESQLDSGGFPYGKGETSESCAWAIVATTMWGIDPNTDPRFIKNGNTAVSNLLSYYVEADAMFEHGKGAGSNAMATEQALYALIAYHRFATGQTALFDYSDVSFGSASAQEYTASLSVNEAINSGDSFSGIVSIDGWDNEAEYKLIDFIINVPSGVTVTQVAASKRLAGGEVVWNVDGETNKLRVVYFDANQNNSLTVSGKEFPAELFTVRFQGVHVIAGSKLQIALSGMSLKRSSDSQEDASMVVVNTEQAAGVVEVVEGVSFRAKCLYTGDDVDLIPSDKKAVAVAVTCIANGTKLRYHDGTNDVEWKYSAEITAKTGVSTYVALVDAAIPMEHFINESYLTLSDGKAEELRFGDTNGDGVVNAQDALNVANAWLRKGDAPTDDAILALNVNGDSRINTFDALGIVEAFVNQSEYAVVTKAATIAANP